jgi:hypothetical protein
VFEHTDTAQTHPLRSVGLLQPRHKNAIVRLCFKRMLFSQTNIDTF